MRWQKIFQFLFALLIIVATEEYVRRHLHSLSVRENIFNMEKAVFVLAITAFIVQESHQIFKLFGLTEVNKQPHQEGHRMTLLDLLKYAALSVGLLAIGIALQEIDGSSEPHAAAWISAE